MDEREFPAYLQTNALIEATKYQDINELQRLLQTEEKSAINETDAIGNTALSYAVFYNNIPIADLLIRNFAICNIYFFDPPNYYTLWECMKLYSYTDMAVALLSYAVVMGEIFHELPQDFIQSDGFTLSVLNTLEPTEEELYEYFNLFQKTDQKDVIEKITQLKGLNWIQIAKSAKEKIQMSGDNTFVMEAVEDSFSEKINQLMPSQTYGNDNSIQYTPNIPSQFENFHWVDSADSPQNQFGVTNDIPLIAKEATNKTNQEEIELPTSQNKPKKDLTIDDIIDSVALKEKKTKKNTYLKLKITCKNEEFAKTLYTNTLEFYDKNEGRKRKLKDVEILRCRPSKKRLTVTYSLLNEVKFNDPDKEKNISSAIKAIYKRFRATIDNLLVKFFPDEVINTVFTDKITHSSKLCDLVNLATCSFDNKINHEGGIKQFFSFRLKRNLNAFTRSLYLNMHNSHKRNKGGDRQLEDTPVMEGFYIMCPLKKQFKEETDENKLEALGLIQKQLSSTIDNLISKIIYQQNENSHHNDFPNETNNSAVPNEGQVKKKSIHSKNKTEIANTYTTKSKLSELIKENSEQFVMEKNNNQKLSYQMFKFEFKDEIKAITPLFYYNIQTLFYRNNTEIVAILKSKPKLESNSIIVFPLIKKYKNTRKNKVKVVDILDTVLRHQIEVLLKLHIVSFKLPLTLEGHHRIKKTRDASSNNSNTHSNSDTTLSRKNYNAHDIDVIIYLYQLSSFIMSSRIIHPVFEATFNIDSIKDFFTLKELRDFFNHRRYYTPETKQLLTGMSKCDDNAITFSINLNYSYHNEKGVELKRINNKDEAVKAIEFVHLKEVRDDLINIKNNQYGDINKPRLILLYGFLEMIDLNNPNTKFSDDKKTILTICFKEKWNNKQFISQLCTSMINKRNPSRKKIESPLKKLLKYDPEPRELSIIFYFSAEQVEITQSILEIEYAFTEIIRDRQRIRNNPAAEENQAEKQNEESQEVESMNTKSYDDENSDDNEANDTEENKPQKRKADKPDINPRETKGRKIYTDGALRHLTWKSQNTKNSDESYSEEEDSDEYVPQKKSRNPKH